MKKNKKIVLRILFAVLLISTFAMIFVFSSQNGDESSNVSQGFIYKIMNLFIKDNQVINSIVVLIEPLVRKLAHFSIYALAGIWAIGLLETYNIKDEKRIGIGAMIGFLYACSDEFHQSFIGERSASPLDVVIDTLGFLVGLTVIMLIINIINYYKKNKI